MKITKFVLEHLAKVFLNLGQGMILGAFISGFLEYKTPSVEPILAFLIGVYTVFIGLRFISELKNVKD